MPFLDALSAPGSIVAIADAQLDLIAAGLFWNGPFDSWWWLPVYRVLA